MSTISSSHVMSTIENALKLQPGTLLQDTDAQQIDGWDSIGQLTILVALDNLFDGKIANIPEIAGADSVNKIFTILRNQALL